MDRLGGEPRSSDEVPRPEEKIARAGARMGEWFKQLVAAIVILAIFVGLLYLRLAGQLGDDGILVYSGVILGYLLHSIKDLI